MNPILRNVLAVVAGWIGGSFVNMGLIQLGHTVLPISGLDPSDMEAYAEMMPSLDAKHFIFPFLAHALGTLVGAAIACVYAANNKMKFAMGIGGLFLLGGIMINYMLPGPTWFAIADIALAYIPMAYIGGKIGEKLATKI
ncbi:hypothetical protein [Portibacter lacus]|uniref:Uncharacterized protein n=1 Tax=Portibacter lacus TaxID=1099794 RepID=A0AA37SPH1_9BACT|nr:hypothetical protein [Portibacter lacus]GLR16764.1 hypothetical protein GCM10007940_13790 [Portibacter lacus]